MPHFRQLLAPLHIFLYWYKPLLLSWLARKLGLLQVPWTSTIVLVGAQVPLFTGRESAQLSGRARGSPFWHQT